MSELLRLLGAALHTTCSGTQEVTSGKEGDGRGNCSEDEESASLEAKRNERMDGAAEDLMSVCNVWSNATDTAVCQVLHVCVFPAEYCVESMYAHPHAHPMEWSIWTFVSAKGKPSNAKCF